MKATDIRIMETYSERDTRSILREIAAQLAEMNERHARAQEFAEKMATRSMEMMDRAEKDLDKPWLPNQR